METSERRRDARARISLPAYLLRRSGAESVETLDASYRGMCIRSKLPLPYQQLLKLRFDLPGREVPLEAHAVVMRVRADAMGRFEIGIRFFALNGQDQVDWESFVARKIYKRAEAA